MLNASCIRGIVIYYQTSFQLILRGPVIMSGISWRNKERPFLHSGETDWCLEQRLSRKFEAIFAWATHVTWKWREIVCCPWTLFVSTISMIPDVMTRMKHSVSEAFEAGGGGVGGDNSCEGYSWYWLDAMSKLVCGETPAAPDICHWLEKVMTKTATLCHVVIWALVMAIILLFRRCLRRQRRALFGLL